MGGGVNRWGIAVNKIEEKCQNWRVLLFLFDQKVDYSKLGKREKCLEFLQFFSLNIFSFFPPPRGRKYAWGGIYGR